MDPGAKLRRDRVEPCADALGNLVALWPGVLVHQHQLQVGEVSLAAEEVVPHQSVERIWRRCARVALHAGDRCITQRFVGERRCRSCRRLERRVLRHVDDHLKFALVVEGQHLHRHEPKRDERDRYEQQDCHQSKKAEAHCAPTDEWSHDAPINDGQPVLMLAMSGATLE